MTGPLIEAIMERVNDLTTETLGFVFWFYYIESAEEGFTVYVSNDLLHWYQYTVPWRKYAQLKG